MSIGYIEREFREMAEEERDACKEALRQVGMDLTGLPRTDFTTFGGVTKKVEEVEYVRWSDVEALLLKLKKVVEDKDG
jgi:hypothetical protein